MSDLSASQVPATEAADASAVYRIWPGDGRAPGSEDWTHSELTMPIPWYETANRMVRNVVVPTLTRFDPAPGTANGSAMVIAPGGAFHFLMIDHEGYKLARLLAARGMTTFVLKYRLVPTPEKHEEMVEARLEMHRQLAHARKTGEVTPVWNKMRKVLGLAEEDGRQAIRFVRAHAAELGVDPNRIGIGGFSAGGAVAMGAACQHDAESRPDFTVDIYGPPRETITPPETAAPLFIVHADDDTQVDPAASARLYTAWKQAGVSAELHIFADGAHGFGTDSSGLLPDTWLVLFDRWLTTQGFLAPDAHNLESLFREKVLEADAEEHARRTRERA